jgi:hypothetical protein
MKTAVVLLTWQRIVNLQSILRSLYRQSFKDFTVVISNGNLSPRAKMMIDKYANTYTRRGMDIVVRHDGNEVFAFRRFYVGKDLYEQGYDVVMFIDDDVTIPDHYIQNCLNHYQPKTYQSGFTWIFYKNGENYYKFRKRVYSNDYDIHYAGTGMSMMDASIFKDDELINNAPPGSQKIEDLWLSYYVYQKDGWKMLYMNTDGVILGGADSVALYKQVQKEDINKADLLKTLVDMGWRIPSTLPDELA